MTSTSPRSTATVKSLAPRNGTIAKSIPAILRNKSAVRCGLVPDAAVAVTPRIGVAKAADWPLRFLVRESP
mgnify:CR=1 FL=1